MIHQLIYNSIKRCDINLANLLFCNIAVFNSEMVLLGYKSKTI